MAVFRNTNGFSYSWSQPYSVTSHNPFYQDMTVHDELVRIEAVDRIVQNQLTYPEAEAIINTIKQKRGFSDD